MKHKWKGVYETFDQIEFRDHQTFSQDTIDFLKAYKKSSRPGFAKNVLPDQSDDWVQKIVNFNIANLTLDKPRSYQLELYLVGLCSNTVIYLPTGSGKTMVS